VALSSEVDRLRLELDDARRTVLEQRAEGERRAAEVATELHDRQVELEAAQAGLDAVLRSRRYRLGDGLARILPGRSKGG
jgi:hypothetical protein